MPEENGRITIAVVGTKLDLLTDKIKVLSDKIDDLVDVTQKNCNDIAVLQSRHENIKEDIANLETKSERWNIINSILGFLAAVAAIVATDLGLKR